MLLITCDGSGVVRVGRVIKKALSLWAERADPTAPADETSN